MICVPGIAGGYIAAMFSVFPCFSSGRGVKKLIDSDYFLQTENPFKGTTFKHLQSTNSAQISTQKRDRTKSSPTKPLQNVYLHKNALTLTKHTASTSSQTSPQHNRTHLIATKQCGTRQHACTVCTVQCTLGTRKMFSLTTICGKNGLVKLRANMYIFIYF